MATTYAGVGTLIENMLKMLAECDPGGQDPGLPEAINLLIDVTHNCSVRLLDPCFNSLPYAADEVQLYLAQIERVQRVSVGSPFRVPKTALRSLRAAGRYIEHTTDLEEISLLLMAVPELLAGYSDFLVRTGGRSARPIIEVLALAIRSGSVYRDCLRRTLPNSTAN